MVRNLNANGNKSKGMARKFAAEPRSDRLVLSTCADEKYAVVTNVWRPLPRRLRLRARPAVRHPQEVPRTPPPNVVTVGCYVLVGLRDYEAPNHRLCDLLEVYSRTGDRLNRAPA
jgi:hypothetical protein